MKVTIKVGNLEYKSAQVKIEPSLQRTFWRWWIFQAHKKRWDTKTQQKKISAQIGRDPFLFHSLHKGIHIEWKTQAVFCLEAKSVFFLLGAPLSTFGSKGLHPEIDFWVNSVIFAVHQPKQKAKKITCKSPMWSCCTKVTILSLEKKTGKSKQIKPIHPENSPLLAGHRKRTVPLLSWIFFSAFFGNFMYIIRPPPRWWPHGNVSPGTFLLFLHLHAVSNEVGTHGTQKASGIPGPRLEGTKTSRWVISLEMIERKTKRYGQFYQGK